MPRRIVLCLPWAACVAALLALSASPAAADAIARIVRRTWWGEPQTALLAQFGRRARVLARPLDFGDSYAQIVLPDVDLGGVRMLAFFQIDKKTGGLKRIQLERPRHGVNPAAFRAVVAALEKAYGRPAAMCSRGPGPQNGYQAATELAWAASGNRIRAIFRDTTIEAFEGCLGGDVTTGYCGLTGQMLVRIAPAGGSAGLACPARRG